MDKWLSSYGLLWTAMDRSAWSTLRLGRMFVDCYGQVRLASYEDGRCTKECHLPPESESTTDREHKNREKSLECLHDEKKKCRPSGHSITGDTSD